MTRSATHSLLHRASLLCLFWLLSSWLQAAPFLWQIEHQGQQSYLFGTIHSAHPQLNRLPDSVNQAFDDATHYYGELELDPQTIATTATLLQLPPQQQLSRLLPDSLKQRVEQQLQLISPALSLALFERLKPWALAVTLALLEDQMQFGQQPGMDQRLFQRARSAGKATGALETPQKQAGVFDGLSRREQLQLLEATVSSLEQQPQRQQTWMEETYAAYASGDSDRFQVLFEQQLQLDQNALAQKIENLLIVQRNRQMANKIDRMLRQHPQRRYFIAVGAAHYASDNGVQAELRKKGWSITRVAH